MENYKLPKIFTIQKYLNVLQYLFGLKVQKRKVITNYPFKNTTKIYKII